jgi:hypothetical protein
MEHGFRYEVINAQAFYQNSTMTLSFAADSQNLLSDEESIISIMKPAHWKSVP